MITFDFIEAYLQSFSLDKLAGLNTQTLQQYALNKLSQLLELNHGKTQQQRWQFFQIPNTEPDDYQERIISLDSSKKVLAGIRHEGENPQKPFISVHLNHTISHLHELTEIIDCLYPLFSKFLPQYLSIWCKPQTDLYENLKGVALSRLNHMVAEPHNLREQPALPDGLSIAPINTEDYYDWYQFKYNNFLKKNAVLSEFMSVNDQEDMNKSMDAGLLWGIYDQKQLIGLIQGEHSQYLGQNCLYFSELFLVEEYQRKNIASRAQLLYIYALRQEKSLIWGTIESNNIPSMKTALKIGRQNIRTEFFYPLTKHTQNRLSPA